VGREELLPLLLFVVLVLTRRREFGGWQAPDERRVGAAAGEVGRGPPLDADCVVPHRPCCSVGGRGWGVWDWLHDAWSGSAALQHAHARARPRRPSAPRCRQTVASCPLAPARLWPPHLSQYCPVRPRWLPLRLDAVSTSRRRLAAGLCCDESCSKGLVSISQEHRII